MARDWAGLCPYSKVSKVTVGLESYGAEPRVVRSKHRTSHRSWSGGSTRRKPRSPAQVPLPVGTMAIRSLSMVSTLRSIQLFSQARDHPRHLTLRLACLRRWTV